MQLKKYFFVLAVFLMLVLPSTLHAQYESGKNYLGPSVGLAFLGSTPDFGASYEYGLKLQNFGYVGIGGIFRYWGYTTALWKYTDILIGAQGNYHFILKGSKFDPFAGLVLAYDAGSVSYSGPFGNYISPSYGGLWLAAQGGVRYWISPTIAISGRIGLGTLGYSGVDFGVDFKF